VALFHLSHGGSQPARSLANALSPMTPGQELPPAQHPALSSLLRAQQAGRGIVGKTQELGPL
jgi:hypothetical protein